MTTTSDERLAAYLLGMLAAQPPPMFVEALAVMLADERARAAVTPPSVTQEEIDIISSCIETLSGEYGRIPALDTSWNAVRAALGFRAR